MPAHEDFKSKILPKVQKEMGLKNPMQVPRLSKVTINVGIGTLTRKTKDFSDVIENIAKISGQKPVVSKSRMAISNFKLRKGMPVGIVATLRGKAMHEFIYRLVHIVLPRVRDFRGLNPKAFDGSGNYSIGFKEALVFPEINPDDLLNVHGIQITVCTTAKDNATGKALLEHVGFPFRKSQK